MENQMIESNPQKLGSFTKSWRLTKMSWKIMMEEKELLVFSLLGLVFMVLVLGVFLLVGLLIINLTGSNLQDFSSQYNNDQPPSWLILLIIPLYFSVFTVWNFFGACVTHGVLTKFRGGNPRFGSSLRHTKKYFGPIFFFSVAQAVFFWVSDRLSRLPIIGSAINVASNIAFSAVSYFALPVIIDSTEKLSVPEIINQSFAVIKKRWGQSIIISTGMIFVALLIGIIFTMLWVAIGIALPHVWGDPSDNVRLVAVWSLIAALALGYALIGVLYSTLSTIVAVAIYESAKTNQKPSKFDESLLNQVIATK